MQFIVLQQGEDVYLPIVRRAYFEKSASPIRHSKLLEILAQILMKVFPMRILLLPVITVWIVSLFDSPEDESFTHLCLQKIEISVVKTIVLKVFRLRGF